MAALRQSFAPVANEIVHAARAPEGDSLLDQAAGNLMRLVTVRPVGDDVRAIRPTRGWRGPRRPWTKATSPPPWPSWRRSRAPAAAAADWLAQAEARRGSPPRRRAQLQERATMLLTQRP